MEIGGDGGYYLGPTTYYLLLTSGPTLTMALLGLTYYGVLLVMALLLSTAFYCFLLLSTTFYYFLRQAEMEESEGSLFVAEAGEKRNAAEPYHPNPNPNPNPTLILYQVRNVTRPNPYNPGPSPNLSLSPNPTPGPNQARSATRPISRCGRSQREASPRGPRPGGGAPRLAHRVLGHGQHSNPNADPITLTLTL